MPRTPIVGANWKCNPATAASLDGLIANINACDVSKCEVIVCPSTLHLGYCADKFTNGALMCPQNCNFTGCGAYTGEMAAEQVADMGMKWVLLGHSERREFFNESDEFLATKLKYALDAGLKVIFCVGEKKEVREQGIDATMAFVAGQLEGIKGLLNAENVVLAYEPVWAIGTGLTASPEQAQETHAAIRAWVTANVSAEVGEAIRIQYGGSAKAANAQQLSECADIDGFLVGGASLKPEFADMVKIISDVKSA